MIYIAAPWARKSEAKHIRSILRAAELPVSSSWMDQPDTPYEVGSCLEEALRDVNEVLECSIFLFLNLELSEGKATELGIALREKKQIYCIGGKVRNVFLHLPEVNHVESVTEFITEARRILAVSYAVEDSL